LIVIFPVVLFINETLIPGVVVGVGVLVVVGVGVSVPVLVGVGVGVPVLVGV
jgi:hypothetical protein